MEQFINSRMIIILFIFLLMLILIIPFFIFLVYINDSNPLPQVPKQPNGIKLTKNYNIKSDKYQWILSWTPSAGTSPITYYYNITSGNNPFLNSSTTSNQVLLNNAKNNTTYNVSLYAQNAFGKSGTVNQQITTAGPPNIKRDTISWNYKLNPGQVGIEGDTDGEIIEAETNLKIGNQNYPNSCGTFNYVDNNPGFTCIFDTNPLIPGEEISLEATVSNKYGDTILQPPFQFTIPGEAPSNPSNIKLNL